MVRHTRESGQKTRSGQAEKKPPRAERIAKRLARAGVASRREVERLIGLGLVAVNGRILATPAVLVTRDDVVTVEGQAVGAPEPTRLWRYHKPVGLLTTNRDPKERATVFENLPEELPRVISVGRLDLNSEGLLLLTNDGALARALELPASGWRRVYRARAHGKVTQAKLDTLKDGVVIEGVAYGPIEATLDKAKEKGDGRTNVWITVALAEGKNREVRRVLESVGLQVNRLLRLAYGPFQLGTLAPGDVEEVGPRVIREQLEGFIAPENLPTGVRTATATPVAGRRSAMADPRRKPSRVRAAEEKAATEAPEREPRAEKSFGAKPRRESGFSDRRAPAERKTASFGDKKPRAAGGFGASRDDKPPRSDRAPAERKTPSFGDKKPRATGGFGASRDEKRPQSDRAPSERKTSSFGNKKPRATGGFGASRDDKPPRSDRAPAERKTSGYGDKKPRDEGGFGERRPRTERPSAPRKTAGFGDKRPREGGDERPARAGPGFGRGKPAARTGEARGFKPRDDKRSNDRGGGFAEKRERPAKGFGEKRERPAGKPFAKPGGKTFAKPGAKPGGKFGAKPGGFKAAGKPAPGGKSRSFTKDASARGAGPRGPKPAGGKPSGPRGPKPGGFKPGGAKPSGAKRPTNRARPGGGARGPKRG